MEIRDWLNEQPVAVPTLSLQARMAVSEQELNTCRIGADCVEPQVWMV